METASENGFRKRGRPRSIAGNLARDQQMILINREFAKTTRGLMNHAHRLQAYKLFFEVMDSDQFMAAFTTTIDLFQQSGGFPRGLPTAALEIGQCLNLGLINNETAIFAVVELRREKRSWTQVGNSFRGYRLSALKEMKLRLHQSSES